MSARALLNAVHTMLVEAHGLEEVEEMLAPPPSREEQMLANRAAILALDGEFA